MGREENVLIFQDTERLSKTNGKLNADLKGICKWTETNIGNRCFGETESKYI